MKNLKLIFCLIVLAAIAETNDSHAAALTWSSSPGTWDVGITANWNGSTAVFNNGDSVTFNNLGAAGSGASVVTLANNVQPAAVAVVATVASVNYTFSGAGVITGSGTLLKTGASLLTINNSNSFTGGLTLGGGMVTLGNSYGAGSGTITLSNGVALFANGSTVTPGNAITVVSGASVTISNNNISPGFSGIISSGDNTAVININLTSLSANADQLDNFSGTVNIGASGVRYSNQGGGSNGGTNATFNLTGLLNSRNALTQNVGALTGSGTLQGASSSAPGNSTIFIGAKNINSTFNGTINEGSASSHTSITKVGSGILTLAGTNTYTGATTVSSGTLTLTNTVTLTNSPTITVNAGAVLNLAGASPFNRLYSFTNQTLKGGGTINQAAVEISGGTLSPGDGIGTLTVSNGTFLCSAGTLLMELNRTNSAATNDMLKAPAITINGGTLLVTNLGSDLQTGDSFKLFSVGIGGSGFTTVSLPASNVLNTVQYVWTNRLAANGSIQVLSGASSVNLTPTNITSVVNNGKLELTWPADHTGWRLQAQTNPLTTGLGTNWVAILNSNLDNHYTNILNAANGTVFYRMVYP